MISVRHHLFANLICSQGGLALLHRFSVLETENLSGQSQREGRSRKPGYHDDRVATVLCSRETMAAAAGEQLSFNSASAATLQDLKLTFYFTIFHNPPYGTLPQISVALTTSLWQGCSSTRHRSGFPWAPPTQDTGRCCTEMFIGVYRLVVFAELMVYGHDSGSSSSVCVDGWFILECHDCSAPQVCSPTQPESNQSDSGQVRL